MAAKKQTKYGTFEGELFYARVFQETMDNSEYHENTNGQYNMVFIPKDSDEVNRMIELGYPEVSMGNKMVKPFDVADGRTGMKLKRPNEHGSGIREFGGAPKVCKGKTNVPWDFIEDGDLGNGTKAFIKVSVYGEGSTASVRLEKIGVTEHVAKEDSGDSDQDGW